MCFGPATGRRGEADAPQDRLCRQRRPSAQTARAALVARFGTVPDTEADVIVALGGDGFMLHTLHRTQTFDTPVYGMNRGTVGFLMNDYSETTCPSGSVPPRKR